MEHTLVNVIKPIFHIDGELKNKKVRDMYFEKNNLIKFYTIFLLGILSISAIPINTSDASEDQAIDFVEDIDVVNVEGTRAYSVPWPTEWGTQLPLQGSASPASHVNILEFYMQFDSEYMYYRIITESDFIPFGGHLSGSDPAHDHTGSTISVVMNDEDIDIVEIPDFGFIIFELGLSTFFDDTAIDDPLTVKDERVMAAPYYWDDVDIESNINPDTTDGPFWHQAIKPSSDLIEINDGIGIGVSGVQMAFPLSSVPDGFNEDTGRATPDYSDFNWLIGSGGWLFGGTSSIWENMMGYHPLKPSTQWVDWYEDNYIAGALDDWTMLFEVKPPCDISPITVTINTPENTPNEDQYNPDGSYSLSGSFTGANYWFESAQVDWGDNDPIVLENLNFDLDTQTFNSEHTYLDTNIAYTVRVIINFYCGPGEATIELIPPSTPSSIPEIEATASVNCEPVEEPQEGECDGKVDYLEIEYLGDDTPHITVAMKKDDVLIYDSDVPGFSTTFVLEPPVGQDTLGTEIIFYIDGVESSRVHTSCSKPIWIGMETDDDLFKITDGSSRNGGLLVDYPYVSTKGGIAPITLDETSFLSGGDDDDDEVDNPVTTTSTKKGNEPTTLVYPTDLWFKVTEVELDTIYVWIAWDYPIGTDPSLIPMEDFEMFTYLGTEYTNIDGLTVYLFEDTLTHSYYSLPLPGIFILVTEGPEIDTTVVQATSVEIENNCVIPNDGGCEGKITWLELEYTGTEEAHVRIEQKDGTVVFEGDVLPGEVIYFHGVDKKETLGTEITIYVDGELHATKHTSCSENIYIGEKIGDFKIVAGASREGGDLTGSSGCTLCASEIDDPDPDDPPEETIEIEYKVKSKFKHRMIVYKDAKPRLSQGQTDTFIIEVNHKEEDPTISVMIQDSKKEGKNDWETFDLEVGESVEMDKTGFIVEIISETEVGDDTYEYEISVYGDSNDNELKEISFLFDKGARISYPKEKKATIVRTL